MLSGYPVTETWQLQLPSVDLRLVDGVLPTSKGHGSLFFTTSARQRRSGANFPLFSPLLFLSSTRHCPRFSKKGEYCHACQA
jgi:hypothetical protein